MRDHQVKRDLTRLHAQGSSAEPRPEHRVELESRLLSRYRDRESRTRRWLMLLNPWNRTARFALVGLALMVLGVGACTTSTTTEMEMGHKVVIDLNNKGEEDVEAINQGLTKYLNTTPGLESISVRVHESVDGSADFEIVAFGTGVDAESLVAGIRSAVPELEDAVIETEALTGTLEESFADKMKREVFQIEIDGGTAEEIRAEIMAQLASQGLDDGAVVDVIQEDGMTEIKVTVEKDVTD